MRELEFEYRDIMRRQAGDLRSMGMLGLGRPAGADSVGSAWEGVGFSEGLGADPRLNVPAGLRALL